jgi:hypothetical protein
VAIVLLMAHAGDDPETNGFVCGAEELLSFVEEEFPAEWERILSMLPDRRLADPTCGT